MRHLHTRKGSRERRAQILRSAEQQLGASCAPGYLIETRHDAQLLTRRAAADPYAAWLKQREAERQRERMGPNEIWEMRRTDADFELSAR